MMIERIRREHGYMTRLLAILRRKLLLLRDEQNINYSLVKEIVDYLSTHSEAIHHPKEDLIYHYYVAHYGNNEGVYDLANDHDKLAQQTSEFSALIDMVLQDAVVPQDIIIERLADFIDAQKAHLDVEERDVIPLILAAFTPSDWDVVEAQWDGKDVDPVFGDTISERYKQLALRVRQDA